MFKQGSEGKVKTIKQGGNKKYFWQKEALWEHQRWAHVLAEQEDVQKERNGQESSPKGASVLWSMRRTQANLRFALIETIHILPGLLSYVCELVNSGTPATLS